MLISPTETSHAGVKCSNPCPDFEILTPSASYWCAARVKSQVPKKWHESGLESESFIFLAVDDGSITRNSSLNPSHSVMLRGWQSLIMKFSIAWSNSWFLVALWYYGKIFNKGWEMIPSAVQGSFIHDQCSNMNILSNMYWFQIRWPLRCCMSVYLYLS